MLAVSLWDFPYSNALSVCGKACTNGLSQLLIFWVTFLATLPKCDDILVNLAMYYLENHLDSSWLPKVSAIQPGPNARQPGPYVESHNDGTSHTQCCTHKQTTAQNRWGASHNTAGTCAYQSLCVLLNFVHALKTSWRDCCESISPSFDR